MCVVQHLQYFLLLSSQTCPLCMYWGSGSVFCRECISGSLLFSLDQFIQIRRHGVILLFLVSSLHHSRVLYLRLLWRCCSGGAAIVARFSGAHLSSALVLGLWFHFFVIHKNNLVLVKGSLLPLMVGIFFWAFHHSTGHLIHFYDFHALEFIEGVSIVSLLDSRCLSDTSLPFLYRKGNRSWYCSFSTLSNNWEDQRVKIEALFALSTTEH